MHCIEKRNIICINNGLTQRDDKKAKCENRLSFFVAHSRLFANNSINLYKLFGTICFGIILFVHRAFHFNFLSNKTVQENTITNKVV